MRAILNQIVSIIAWMERFAGSQVPRNSTKSLEAAKGRVSQCKCSNSAPAKVGAGVCSPSELLQHCSVSAKC